MLYPIKRADEQMNRFYSVFLVGLVMLIGCSEESDINAADATGMPGDGTQDTGLESDAVTGGIGDPLCQPQPGACNDEPGAQPGRLSEHSAVYVAETAEMLVFGGSTAVPINCGFPDSWFVAELWHYNERCMTWSRSDIEGGPSPRGRHMAAAGDGAMWVFGGRYRADGMSSGDYILYDDLWRYDVAAQEWEEIAIHVGPQPRINGGLVWDSQRKVLWLMGGNTSASGMSYFPQNDLWSFDPVDQLWTQHFLTDTDSSVPSPRLFHQLIYDSERDQLVLFGGADEGAFFSADYHDDIWAFDIDAMVWQQLDQDNSPDGRFWSGFVYEEVTGQYLLFGGHDDQNLGNRNDLWAFEPDGVGWVSLLDGDAYNMPANGFCDFPPDFVTYDLRVPERRNAHTFVYSPVCERSLLFGGKTDCGAINDVWGFYSSDGWHELVSALEGETCGRWREGITNCANLCF
jgi:N-acetylneuraminic acid mutarotase